MSAGSSRYFTNVPCKHGHLVPRRTSDSKCIECARIRVREYARKNKKANRKRAKDWYWNNLERAKSRIKDYYHSNEEYRSNTIARAAAWNKKNADVHRAICSKKNAKRRSKIAGGDSTAKVVAWMKQQPKICHWCEAGCEDEFHLDHYVPLAKGGSHTTDNFVIACPPCNLRKNAQDPYEFAQRMGRLF